MSEITKILMSVILAILTGVCGFGVSVISKLCDKVDMLNNSMAAALVEIATAKEETKELKLDLAGAIERIRSIELRRHL